MSDKIADKYYQDWENHRNRGRGGWGDDVDPITHNMFYDYGLLKTKETLIAVGIGDAQDRSEPLWESFTARELLLEVMERMAAFKEPKTTEV
jgi:hypothetical protein